MQVNFSFCKRKSGCIEDTERFSWIQNLKAGPPPRWDRRLGNGKKTVHLCSVKVGWIWMVGWIQSNKGTTNFRAPACYLLYLSSYCFQSPTQASCNRLWTPETHIQFIYADRNAPVSPRLRRRFQRGNATWRMIFVWMGSDSKKTRITLRKAFHHTNGWQIQQSWKRKCKKKDDCQRKENTHNGLQHLPLTEPV